MKIPTGRLVKIALALLVSVLVCSSDSFAATSWIVQSGEWKTPANWSGSKVPNSSTDAVINNDGNAFVSSGGVAAFGLYAGYSGSRSGSVNITGGSLSVVSSYLGFAANTTGIVDITKGTWTHSSNLFIGNNGKGFANIQGGAVSNLIGYIGYGVGSSGTATVSGGTWKNTNGLYVGASGTGVLTITNTGIVTVTDNGNNNNNANGTLFLASAAGSNGTLNIGTGGVAGTLQASTVSAGSGTATVNFNHTGSTTFSSALTGNLSLNKLGLGTTILTGSNNYTGKTTISQGTLQIGNGTTVGSLGTGAVVDNGTLAFNSSGIVTVANSISGTGSFLQMGTGTTVLSAANSYSGTTTILKGFVQISANNRLGTSRLVINGGGIRYGAAFNDFRDITVGTGGATIDTNGFNVFNGFKITGNGGFTKIGAGVLTLTGSNSYTGPTIISAGGLQIGDGMTVGSIGASKITNNGALAFKYNFLTNTIANVIDGKGAVIQNGNNTLILTGANSYEGGTLINSGAIKVGNAKALGATKGNLTISQGTLDLNGFNVQVGALSSSATATITTTKTGTATLTTNSDLNSLYRGAITNGSGVVSLVKTGKGMLTLSGSNSFSGGLILSSGTLAINGAYVLGTGPLTINGSATLDNVRGSPVTIASNNVQNWNSNFAFQGSSNLNLGTGNVFINNSRTVTVTSNTLTVGGVIAASNGSYGLTKSGTGTLLLTANNTYTGQTTVDKGILQIGNGGATGAILSTKIQNNGELIFNRSTNVTIPGLISGNGSVAQMGTGTLSLTGANTYNGGTIITAGAVKVGNAKALGLGTLTISSALLDLGGFSTTITSLAGDAGARIVNTGAPAAFLTSQFESNTVYAGTISDGVGGIGLILSGKNNGILTLTGSNSYSRGTTLNSGELDLGNANAIGTGALTIIGGTLDNVTGSNLTLATNNAQNWNGNFAFKGTQNLNLGTGNVVMNGTRTVTVSSGTLTVGGVVSSTGTTFGLTKTGAGSLILAGNDNTYGGPTTVSQGLLQIGTGGVVNTFSSSALANNGTVIFNASNTLFYRGIISGNGSLVQNGNGLLFISGANTYTGGTIVNSGTLRTGNVRALGATTGNLVVNGVVELNGGAVGVGTLSGSGIVANFGAQAVTLTETNGSTTLFSGRILDNTPGAPGATSLSFVKAGNGTLILTGNNGYTGGTTITAGTLQLGNGGPTGTILGGVVNNGILAFNYNTNADFNGFVTGKGSLQQLGFGSTLTLTAANDYTGGTTIGVGSALRLVDGGSFGSGSVLDNGSLVFDFDSDTAIANVINGTGYVVQDGSAVLSLNGANNFSGGTVINSGTVIMGNARALGASSSDLVMNGGVLDLNNFSLTVGRLSGNSASSTIINTGTIVSTKPVAVTTTIAAGDNSVFAGTILDGPATPTSLTKVGSGTLTLTGNNTYTGGTVISTGVLSVGNNGTTGAIAGNVDNRGALIFKRSNAYTYRGQISGGGSVTQAGSGTLTVTGSNSYTGGTALQNGTLAVGNDSALGKGNLTLTNGTLATDGAQHVINVTGNLIWNSDAHIALTLTPNADSEFVAVTGQFLLQGNSALIFDFNPVGLPPGHTNFLVMTVAGGFNGLTPANFGFTSTDLGFEGEFRINGTELWFDDGYEPAGYASTSGLSIGGPAAVPEPSTYAMLVIGAAVFFVARRMRRARN